MNCKFLLFVLLISLNCLSQVKKDRGTLRKEYALKELNKLIADSCKSKKVAYRNIIDDSTTAVKFAELMAFEAYGKRHIKRQRPYDIFHIEYYWVITGTLPENRKGGTFRIILDERDGKVLRLIHGK